LGSIVLRHRVVLGGVLGHRVPGRIALRQRPVRGPIDAGVPCGVSRAAVARRIALMRDQVAAWQGRIAAGRGFIAVQRVRLPQARRRREGERESEEAAAGEAHRRLLIAQVIGRAPPAVALGGDVRARP
jgi:hypothetical protein